ncbi:methylated-DNA--[protein]-cysteine S-methyltransferase [Mycolicibacterium arseniciresistens]|uniref:Methylated-DNA--protein-cysteine methyltransferase n=1 Tax=Mycolicibacterium arseniciresistens TaxID=3062257 RepID=A0ABT8UJE0_9MYCO|nr:methylated-DNA--[protein]-cysteine S-methyltransferase [Mycolicibacterium arseniciresistens]MDO3636940.1 methylated-DNA--[protein]-cysteine S-methyltransferase [Mycolicibacterium arseniciresistens]
MSIRHTVIDSPLDDLTLAAEGDALIGLYFQGHWPRPAKNGFGQRVDADTDPLLAEAQNQLCDYLAGKRTTLDLPIDPRGDITQRRVWQQLTAIPYGATVTYGELADTAGGLTAREVGQIVGRNPLSIVIPCHRVVGKAGRLTGYAGGVARKKLLLDLEEPAERRAARLF